jgi:valyl-tRNA synthetase
MKIRALLLITILLGAAFTHADEGDRDRIIRQIIEISGLEKQIEQYPAIVISGIRNQQKGMEGKGVDREEYRKLVEAVEDSFRAELFYQEVYDRMDRDFDPKHAEAVLKWISSPLSRKMAELEIASTTVEAVAATEAYAEQMAVTPPSRKRLELVQRLDRATRSTEHNREMSLAVTEAMLRVLAPLMPLERQMSEKQIQDVLETQQMQMKREEPGSQISFLYTYRSVTDEELAEYIEGYETEAGAWLNRIIAESLKEAMVHAAANAARRLAGSVA